MDYGNGYTGDENERTNERENNKKKKTGLKAHNFIASVANKMPISKVNNYRNVSI